MLGMHDTSQLHVDSDEGLCTANPSIAICTHRRSSPLGLLRRYNITRIQRTFEVKNFKKLINRATVGQRRTVDAHLFLQDVLWWKTRKEYIHYKINGIESWIVFYIINYFINVAWIDLDDA